MLLTRLPSYVTLLLFISQRVASISWLKPSPSHLAADSSYDDLAAHHAEEIANIIRNAEEHLQVNLRQPDCFQLVARTIRTQCDELDMNEEERIKAAISMTLCELQTALHSPPMECSSFTAKEDPSEGFSSRPNHKTCVEALSRSAQYWSSYSGYLREVPQLCFAFRRWNDIDTAKNIYRNTTLDNAALIRLLLDREREMHRTQERASHILQGMHTLLENLHTTSAALSSTSEQAAEKLQARSEVVLETLQAELLHLHKLNEGHQENGLSKMETAISGVINDHAASLIALIPNIESSIQGHIDLLFSRSRHQHQEILDMIYVVRDEWNSLSQEMGLVQVSIKHLTSSAHSTAVQLEIQASEALLSLHVQQQSATDSAHRLSEVLTSLTLKMKEEMDSINGTATAVREGLLAQSQGSSNHLVLGERFKTGVLWLLEIVLRVDPGHLNYLFQLPAMRLCSATFGVVGYLARASFSTVASIAVLLFSSKRWFSETHQDSSDTETGNTLSSRAPATWSIPSSRHSNCFSSGGSRNRYRSRAASRLSRIPNRLLDSPASSGFGL